MQNKKETVRQIFVFMFFLVILTGVSGAFQLNSKDTEIKSMDGQLLSFLSMFTPAAASLLARAYTKEGMKESFLRFNFKGNVKYYLLAVILILICGALDIIYTTVFTDAKINLSKNLSESGIGVTGFFGMILINLSSCVAVLPVFLGEELGWRGYLYPKLLKVMNRPAALITGGVIWGVWHSVPIICGLNFGFDYPGYPYVGIGLMCIDCISSGILLMWITEKTGSVYPAGIAHAVNNKVVTLVTSMALDGNFNDDAVIYSLINSLAIFTVSAFCIAEGVISNRKKQLIQPAGEN